MMTLEEAMALQPAWLTYWIYVLTFGVFLLPLTLLIWRQTRLTTLFIIIANIGSFIGVEWLFANLGYVKLLGLPHIILYTPLVIYLLSQYKRSDMPVLPKRIIMAIMAVILVSLAFDYTDALRYLAGSTAPFPGTEPSAAS